MKKWTELLLVLTLLVLASGTAYAAGIAGRLGVTGQLGFTAAAKSSYDREFARNNGLSDRALDPETAFVGGGGLIYGVTKNLALEFGALYLAPADYENSRIEALTISATDVSLGLQLRNNFSEDMAAYLGCGVDLLLSEVKDPGGNEGDAETVVGGHVSVGGDYFVTPGIALNFDLRGLLFPEAELKSGGVTVAHYNPITFVGLVGVRFFLN